MTRTRVVHVVAVAVVLALGAAAVGAARAGQDPYAPLVTMSVTPPGGQATTLEARESAVVKLNVGDVEYKFRPTILDAKPWNQVIVTIFKGPTADAPDQVLGDVELRTGGPAVDSKTSPVFKIAVTKVTAAPNPAEMNKKQ